MKRLMQVREIKTSPASEKDSKITNDGRFIQNSNLFCNQYFLFNTIDH